MAKKQTKSKSVTKKRLPTKVRKQEPDSAYFLKLVMYFIFGTMWVHVSGSDWVVPLPFGFAIGMAFASHDHFKIDRKIEYAVLVVSMFITYFLAPRFVIAF